MITLCCTSSLKSQKIGPSLKGKTIKKKSFMRVCWPPSPPCWSHQSQSALLDWLAPRWAPPSGWWSSPSASCPPRSSTINPPCCSRHTWWWRWKLGKNVHTGQLRHSRAARKAVCSRGFTFLNNVDDRFGSQSVVQRNRDQRISVTSKLTDGPLHTDTNTNNEHLQHPLFHFCWIFSSFQLKRILVAPHRKLFGSRVTQISKKLFFVFY